MALLEVAPLLKQRGGLRNAGRVSPTQRNVINYFNKQVTTSSASSRALSWEEQFERLIRHSFLALRKADQEQDPSESQRLIEYPELIRSLGFISMDQKRLLLAACCKVQDQGSTAAMQKT
jgi:hypothetical protein